MHSKRLGVGVAVVNRLLYAIGGFDGEDRLATMECYHPENNAWTILPSMKIGRSGAGVAALNQFIYVVGGFDGRIQLSSVERYDTEQQVWDSVATILIARSALSLTVLDGKLYAMGGFDGQSFLSIVEVYDPAIDRWEEGTPLTTGRSGHASAVIYQPSCASIYMDCIEEPVEKNDPSPDDDEKSNNGPTTSKNTSLPSTSTNALHSFSGNHCNHCDNSQQSDTLDGDGQRKAHMEHLMTHGPNTKSMSADDQSKYEQQCRRAVCSLLQMDCEEKRARKELLRNCQTPTLPQPTASTSSDVSFEIHEDGDSRSSWTDTYNENPKKYRRREPNNSDDDDTDLLDSDSRDSNSRDSTTSNGIAGDLRRKKTHHCALSKLTNSFRQNINDFVAWSSSSTSPSSITADIANNNNNDSFSSKARTDGRKYNLLKKYYKCKVKN